MAKKKKEVEVNFSNIGDVLNTINQKFGANTIMVASEATSLTIERIPFNVFDLDLKIGGGIPRGRLIQLKGDYSVGKSYLALKGVASFQRHCRFCGQEFEHISPSGEVIEKDCLCGRNEFHRVVWVDAEHCFDRDWATNFGVDQSKMAIIQPNSAEKAIDAIDVLIRSHQCDVIVLDSVAAMPPQQEIDISSGDDLMGKFARQMGKALRKWTSGMNTYGLTSELKCTGILINQVRLNLGGYIVGHTNPGGKALDAHSSLNINFKRTGPIEDKTNERPIGINVDYVVTKNKTYPPFLSGTFELYTARNDRYPIGESDNDKQLIRSAVYWKLLEKGGAGWFTLPDGSKVQGEAALADKIFTDTAIYEDLVSKIKIQELSWAKNKKPEDEVVVELDADQEIVSEGF